MSGRVWACEGGGSQIVGGRERVGESGTLAAARRGQASLALAAWESQGCPVRRALLFVRPAPAPGLERLVREEHASLERQCSGLNACEDDAPRLIHIGHHVGGTKTDDAGPLPMGSWTVGRWTAESRAHYGGRQHPGRPR